YLAKRDADWMGPVYHMLGIKAAAIGHDESYIYDPEVEGQYHLRQISRKEAYQCDVIYGTNSEFGFDYLRDNMVYEEEEKSQNGHPFAIVDEVDSILIDEARTPLIISGPAERIAGIYRQFERISQILKAGDDYEVLEKEKTVAIEDSGYDKAQKALGVDNLHDSIDTQYESHLRQALKAKNLFKKDVDYVVKDGEIVIVDEFTGRLMFGRRYSEGLHQAIEAKEKVAIREESKTLATITIQNYFRMYEKLAGMTGTAATEADEFMAIYKLETVVIPTNQPLQRNNMADVIYKNDEAKFTAVVEDVVERNKKGQPVLLGTVSIDKSELLSKMLNRRGIKHNVLNAKNHEREAEIIAQAGKKGAVTVATNMAGRGVDIVLGGNPQDEKEAEEVIEAGGLHVVGTERHEARRIDNQLRGRSGRQGDPGSTQFYISLNDDLMRLFAADRIKWVMEKFNLPEDQPIEHRLISKSIESAQKQVESYNFSIRKHILEYDDVMNKQREVIYSERDKVLANEDLSGQIKEFVADVIEPATAMYLAADYPEEWELKEMLSFYYQFIPIKLGEKDFDLETATRQEVTEELLEKAYRELEKRQKELGAEEFGQLSRYILLEVITNLWTEYLSQMDALQEGINLRAIGQRDPLVEFKNEAFAMFQQLTANIKEDCLRYLFRANVVEQQHHDLGDVAYDKSEYSAMEQSGQVASDGATTTTYVAPPKVGRNDPCPCGATNSETGKPMKYKKCCGKEAS
ncbi:MAG: preprotein translocase subunit SecA, partial [Actinobacteria bacterium]